MRLNTGRTPRARRAAVTSASLRPLENSETRVGESHRLEAAQRARAGRQALRLDLVLHLDDAADFAEKPRINLAGGVDGLVGQAEPHGLRDLQQAVRRRRPQCRANRVAVVALPQTLDGHLVEPGQAGLQRAQRLLQALLEGAADRHRLADRFHRGGEDRLGAGKLLESEARDLGDDVVDGRLEARGGRAAGDVVGDLVQGVADGELGRDLGDREAGRLRRQRGGARHPRVHLDDDQAPIRRVDRELHVRAAGLHPDLAQHRDRGVAHDLVFLVGQRERRSDRDRVAGVHAHRVEVLDRADDDAVVVLVANDLHLEFLPAEDRFLDQHLVGRRGIDAALDDVDELGLVVGDAAAGAAERERRPDDRRQPDLVERLERVGQRLDLLRARGLQPDPLHRLAEASAVLGLVDGIRGRADHLDAELVEHAEAAQRQRGVERGLPAHGGKQRVRTLLLDDLGDDVGRDRLDIGGVGEVGVGHDRGRIGVDQHDPVAFLL